jgi:hypothetical protein
MPIDHRIYLEQVGTQSKADMGQAIMDGMKGASLRDFARARESGDAGAQKKSLADLARFDPENAMKLTDQMKTDQAAETQRKALRAADLALGVTDQKSYTAARNLALSEGLMKPEELPETYDPKLINNIQYRALSLKDRLEQMNKETELRLKEREIGQKRGGVEGGLTEAEKSVDKDYAKDYNNFTTGGRDRAQNAINRLKTIKKELEDAGDGAFAPGGGRAAFLPDFTRDKKSIEWRDSAHGAANNVLKELMGGQISDADRKSLAAGYYNDKLSNAQNAQLMNDKILELEQKLSAETSRAKHYERNRTSKGFKFEGKNYPQDVIQYANDNGMTPDEVIALRQLRESKPLGKR